MSGALRIGDTGRILRFRFDGKVYEGREGDTLASALLANGVHLLGRSFKYHRPRGLLTAGADEPNALVQVRRDDARVTPNLRATQVELHEGLEAFSQNRSPSLEHDHMGVNDRFSRFIPAGFYYKTFMWPKGAWDKWYEPRIRAAAGLGEAPVEADPDIYAQRYAYCDVLVVGAGPAGLAAALAAGESGARVILCDEQAEMGGTLRSDSAASIDGKSGSVWLAQTLGRLEALPNVTLLSRTTAFGWYPHMMIGLCERLSDHLAAPSAGMPRERLWQVRAKQAVLAAGAIERPLVFPDNDRPGILMAGAARAYLRRHGVLVGRAPAVLAANDGGYRAALELAAAGAKVAAIVELRAAPPAELAERARAVGIRVITDATVEGTRGKLRVDALDLNVAGRAERIACDCVLMANGETPSVHLFSQSRGKLTWDAGIQAFVPGQSVEAERSAGACRGRFGLAAALADGAGAGAAAARDAGFEAASPAFAVEGDDVDVCGVIGALPHRRRPDSVKAFVDWQNDVTAKDIVLATREGFRSIEHIKRYTTTGMATDQGKTSNINALGIASEVLGRPIPDIGLTTFRPPYTPVTFGAIAGTARGMLFDPARTTPIHCWAEARGAVFEEVGQWLRARYFPEGKEDMHSAVNRECVAVRERVGLFDASTLGKIEVVGPDAAEFMNRLYVNAWTKLGIGKCRYGVLLREDGFVMDDGVVGRLAADRFHVTTTTGGAARVLGMMEDYLQTEWPDLDVWLTSTTEQWSVIAVQGPKAREVIAPLVEGIDISAEAFPHMSIADATICGGIPMRLMRVSFTGEIGFEVNVPSGRALEVWEAIHVAGQPFGITCYGTETMHVLRAEKGYIIVGQETDGTVTPDDAGLSWAIGKAKPDFVGKRSLARPALAAAGRKQLVGLQTENPGVVLEEGAQITLQPDAAVPIPLVGHVTSSYYSAYFRRSIALALVAGGRGLMGSRLHVPMPDGAIPVRVVDPVFYDREGTRIHG